MSRFTTRVELLGSPDAKVYDKLHEAMLLKDFKRAFTDNGRTFETPHAEYVSWHTISTPAVVELAKQAAASVWKDFRIMTTSTEVRWEYYNLKQLS
jgi:hypothetical protein